jgi:hypothetical protein
MTDHFPSKHCMFRAAGLSLNKSFLTAGKDTKTVGAVLIRSLLGDHRREKPINAARNRYRTPVLHLISRP